MIVGPRIVADKSFLQSLNGDLIDELTLYFTTTSPPVLISEIIADLKREPKAGDRIGKDLVKELATKMIGAQGAQPPTLLSLVRSNLHGQKAPMHGYTLPVMVGTPGVISNASGTQLIVSQMPQQGMWARWAAGDFSTEDEKAATAWRAGIETVDVDATARDWKDLAKKLGSPKSLEKVVEAADRCMADRSRTVQTNLINYALSAVRGEMKDKTNAINHFVDLPKGVLLTECAPYAAAVARAYICFGVGLACNVVSRRATNVIDLDYILYAPFGRVFVSSDNFQRVFWKSGAVTSNAEFVWGPDFRAELKQRNNRRRSMTFEEWEAHRRVHGEWPVHLDGSIVTDLWERHCPNWPRGGSDSPNVGKHIDEIDDPQLKRVIAAMNKLLTPGEK